MQWFLKCWKNYANFQGRARRKEYWFFFLFNAIAGFVLDFFDGLLSLQMALRLGFFVYPLGLLSSLYCLAALLPGLAVVARRLHDSNRSGWWMLIGLVPVIGGIWLLVLMLLDSTYGPNRYGLNPKGLGNPEEGEQPQIA